MATLFKTGPSTSVVQKPEREDPVEIPDSGSNFSREQKRRDVLSRNSRRGRASTILTDRQPGSRPYSNDRLGQ